MGLFGPSLAEKIRRSAETALPQATWTVDVDWSGGEKLHQVHGSLPQSHSEADTMQFARDVWAAIVAQHRLHPDDGRDGLLDVGVRSLGVAEQCTGVHG